MFNERNVGKTLLTRTQGKKVSFFYFYYYYYFIMRFFSALNGIGNKLLEIYPWELKINVNLLMLHEQRLILPKFNF